MTPDQLSHIAQQWFAAFNSHDLAALLALYAEDAEHYSPKLQLIQPETHGWIKGKKALHDWWQGAFLRLPTLQYELLKLTANEHRVFMEYIRHVTGEEDLRVGEVLEISDHLIVSSRVYHG